MTTAAPPSLLDPPFVRLSDSPLWDRQQEYFTRQGPRAWSTGTVPHYVTSTPYLARAYADVIAGFGDDVVAGARESAPRTVTIVELGAGTGRLGWNIVRALRTIVDARRRGWRPLYVLTDFAEATVAWWQAHPWLRPLFEAGLLDVARYDLMHDRELTLRHSGRTISRDAPANAMVVVANYVFDSVPQDVFAVHDGQLHEYLADARLAIDVDGRGFAAADLAYDPRPVHPVGYYGDPLLDGVLAGYRAGEGAFSFPAPALRGLGRLFAMCRGPALLLSGDKGDTRRDRVMADSPPALVVHGSVSMSVNYHAIGAWTAAQGGRALFSEHRGEALEVCAFVLGLDDQAATVTAFERAIAQRSPDDFYALKRLLVARASELSLRELLSYLRLAGHDPKLFLDCAPAITAAIDSASDETREDLARALARVWDGYLPIGERSDLGFALGEVAAALDRHRDAISFFEASIAVVGVRADTCARLATHYAAVDEPERAASWRALARAAAPTTPTTRPRVAARPVVATTPLEDPFALFTATAP